MCGRYTLGRQPDALLDYFHLHGVVPVYHLSWNIAPGQTAPVVVHDREQQRVCQLMRWGLVPAWSSGPDSRYSMINAKAETIDEKPAYKKPFRSQRCLVPCDGFYEWQATSSAGGQKVKQPYYIYRKDQSLLALAGIWERWHGADNAQSIASFSIITTDANSFMQDIHQRMPVILEPEQFDSWLSATYDDRERLKLLLCPYQRDELVRHPVSRAVNSPKNDSVDLIEAVE